MATWLNSVQELAEGRRLGTPVLFVTNPRNHYGTGAHLRHRGSRRCVLPVAGDPRAGRHARRGPGRGVCAHSGAGVRRGRDPRRLPPHRRRRHRAALGPLPGDARRGRRADCAIIAALVRGFQGPTLGPRSVALTTKHFPGAGPARAGHDAHFAWGKTSGLPGPEARPPPPSLESGHRGGHRHDHAVLRGGGRSEPRAGRHVLSAARSSPTCCAEKLGFQGVVNSDTGITTGHAVGRRVALGEGAVQEGDRGGGGPARRRRDAGADRRARQGGCAAGDAHRRVGAPHPARAVRARPVREPVRQPGRGGAHGEEGGVPGQGGPRPAQVHRLAEERGRPAAAEARRAPLRGRHRSRRGRPLRLRLDQRSRPTPTCAWCA